MNKIPDEIRDIWNESSEEEYVMKIDQIRAKSESFAKTVKWRNIREYCAAVIVSVVYCYYAFKFDVLLVKIGSLGIVAAAIFVMMQLKKRSASTTVNPGTEPIISFHLKQLERERDAMRSVWAWYLLPVYPGFILITAGLIQSRPGADFTGYFVVVLLINVFILWYNAWGANRLQKEIDALPSI